MQASLQVDKISIIWKRNWGFINRLKIDDCQPFKGLVVIKIFYELTITEDYSE